jgi:hypothetical protein
MSKTTDGLLATGSIAFGKTIRTCPEHPEDPKKDKKGL